MQGDSGSTVMIKLHDYTSHCADPGTDALPNFGDTVEK